MNDEIMQELEGLTRRNKRRLELAQQLREVAVSFVPMGCEVGPVAAFGEDTTGILSEIEAGLDRFDEELRKLGIPVELDGPPTEPGWYWLFTPAFPEENDPAKLEVVKAIRYLDSLVFLDQFNRVHCVRMYKAEEGCRWWACPEPEQKDGEK